MPITLPRQKVEATQKSPQTLIMYGLPKVGKTELLSKLDDCLIIDHESGTKRYPAMAVQAETYAEMNEVLVALNAEYKANGNKPVYKYIADDTLDILEDIAVHKAAEFYKQAPGGKKWFDDNYSSPGILRATGSKVTTLPNGLGYLYVREAMQWYTEVLGRFCKYLILVSHIKDKKLPSMDGVTEVIVKDISLSGKLGSILCARADAISYLFRDSKGELMMSFKTNDTAVMGSRCPHLAGKVIPADWSLVYID